MKPIKVKYEIVDYVGYGVASDIYPETNINDLKKIIFNKNEKILNKIIKPKEELIKQLYKENKELCLLI